MFSPFFPYLYFPSFSSMSTPFTTSTPFPSIDYTIINTIVNSVSDLYKSIVIGVIVGIVVFLLLLCALLWYCACCCFRSRSVDNRNDLVLGEKSKRNNPIPIANSVGNPSTLTIRVNPTH